MQLLKLFLPEIRELLDEQNWLELRELLLEIPAPDISDLLEEIDDSKRIVVLRLLGYPEESVGRLMTPDYVAIRPEWTVEEALAHIRFKGLDSETTNLIYVTDQQWHLIGVLSLRRLILAKTGERIQQIMDASRVFVS